MVVNTFLDCGEYCGATPSNDGFSGTSWRDSAYENGGNDKLDGSAGDDYVAGDANNDTLGNNVNERLYGYFTDGGLYPTFGNDSLSGSNGYCWLTSQ